MSERKIQKHLESKGYSTYNLDPTWVTHQKRTAFYNIPQKKLNQLKKYVSETYEDSNTLKVLLAMDSRGLPDLIAFKDDKILFIEVKKSNTLSQRQVEWSYAFSEFDVYVANCKDNRVAFYKPNFKQVSFTGDGVLESKEAFKDKISNIESLLNGKNLKEIQNVGYIPVNKK